ncbi:transferrin-binding protein-like solute binding protein, partial [Sphingomonas sp.]|uniref:transferrin-binding protein-like solute binding protein n=1 Tax=Sphingomonas sp. TaxID=28214 RepID=UPI002BF9FB7E
VEGAQLYAGNASSVRTPSGTVVYNPRDGVFTVSFVDDKANISLGDNRFQDPAHRTDFGGSLTPQWGVPTDLTDFNFLESAGPEAGSPRVDAITFFYQRPGSQTTYVSLAGYVRNTFTPSDTPGVFAKDSNSVFQRGAMVFGAQTSRTQIPVTGTASYEGGMLATMVVNNTLDSSNPQSTYFQWITGSSKIDIDFGKSTMSMLLTGTASAANYAGQTLAPGATGVPGGSTFTATGAGTIDLASTGGFTGQFSQAGFSNANNGAVPVFDRANPGNSVAGANSIDGTFFGPNAVNVGGNFRIVGGVPDQRVDILGAFTGAKK